MRLLALRAALAAALLLALPACTDALTIPGPGSPGEDVPPGTVLGSWCEDTGTKVTCPHQSTTLWSGLTGLAPREVHWMTPFGVPPVDGWPVAIVFQGSVVTAETFWFGLAAVPFGAIYQARTIKELLDAGYAVVAPEAHLGGFTAWDTSIPPFSFAWGAAPDHQLMLDIFEGIETGLFGDVDPTRLYATGISSGGYMTSRMAVSYPGKFRALVIHAGSYATCAGVACIVPELPSDHPPTRFLHGALDAIVPLFTMRPYRKKLEGQGTPTDEVIDPWGVHEWLSQAPSATVDWFDQHP